MIRVVIVDDQKVVTQGLKVLLESEPDIQIVGTGANGQEAIDLVKRLSPNVLLIDQYMPVMDGVQATQTIAQQFPDVAVLLLSGSEEDEHIAEAIQAGARGYLLKTISAEDLANSIRSVDRGYSQMGPGMLQRLLTKMNAPTPPASSPPMQVVLNPLEAQLLELLERPTEFNCSRLTQFQASVQDGRDAAMLMTQIEKQLQQRPDHVSALYLSGQLIWAFQRHDRLAMNCLRLALSHAQGQGFPLVTLFQICQGAWAINTSETFTWLLGLLRGWPTTQPGGTFFEAMGQVFDTATEPYRWVRAAWEIDHLNQLWEPLSGLRSELNF